MTEGITVLIQGASGSGKTTLGTRLVASMKWVEEFPRKLADKDTCGHGCGNLENEARSGAYLDDAGARVLAIVYTTCCTCGRFARAVREADLALRGDQGPPVVELALWRTGAGGRPPELEGATAVRAEGGHFAVGKSPHPMFEAVFGANS